MKKHTRSLGNIAVLVIICLALLWMPFVSPFADDARQPSCAPMSVEEYDNLVELAEAKNVPLELLVASYWSERNCSYPPRDISSPHACGDEYGQRIDTVLKSQNSTIPRNLVVALFWGQSSCNATAIGPCGEVGLGQIRPVEIENISSSGFSCMSGRFRDRLTTREYLDPNVNIQESVKLLTSCSENVSGAQSLLRLQGISGNNLSEEEIYRITLSCYLGFSGSASDVTDQIMDVFESLER